MTTGSTAWGHDTGVTQTNIRDFAGNWHGNCYISGSGDSEAIEFGTDGWMESEVVDTGVKHISLDQNVYAAGDDVTIKYRTGATSAECEEAVWIPYTASFWSLGYVQIRLDTGTVYYVDATTGSDGDTGLTPDLAWATIAKVEASTFQPGDMILFKRGETWRGESLAMPSSGASGNPITFGAYGSGANPIIDPTTEFNDWTLDSGAIWKRSQVGASSVKQVFEDGTRMIFSADKASMVAGSWAYDSGVPGVVHVWCSDSGNPSTEHVVEYDVPGLTNIGVFRLNGKSYITIDSIDFYRPGVGIITEAVGTTNVVIQNCNFSYSGGRSILLGTDGSLTYTYPTDVTISNCIGHDDLDVPFWIGHGTRLIVEDCEAYNSGADVTPNGKLYPLTHFPNGILVSAESVDCIIRNNYVHNIYVGAAILDELSLGVVGDDTIIDGNLVDQTGRATYCIQIEGDNTIVRNNILYAGSGSAILLNNTPASPLIYHNTIVSPSGSGNSIDCVLNPGATVKNNIVVRAGATGRYLNVPAAAQTNFEADNNLYYGASTHRWFWGPTEYTTFATWKSNSSQDANGFNEDPVVVTQWTDLHLQAGSPCRNAGEDLNVATDYDGVARDDTPDIGAYEYVA